VDAKNLADLYGLPLIDWARVEGRLGSGIPQAPGTGGPNRHTCWLATIDPDGSPHITGVGAVWVDDTFWFETGERSRKGRNLARDPRCTLSVATDEFDLVVEGEAHRGTALTAEYSAPSAGPPPWHVFRITPRSATAVLTVEPGGATRWRFTR